MRAVLAERARDREAALSLAPLRRDEPAMARRRQPNRIPRGRPATTRDEKPGTYSSTLKGF